MDHIMGLVLAAGSLRGERKRIVATKTVLSYLSAAFHEDRLWPNLASSDGDDEAYKYLYSP